MMSAVNVLCKRIGAAIAALLERKICTPQSIRFKRDAPGITHIALPLFSAG